MYASAQYISTDQKLMCTILYQALLVCLNHPTGILSSEAEKQWRYSISFETILKWKRVRQMSTTRTLLQVPFRHIFVTSNTRLTETPIYFFFRTFLQNTLHTAKECHSRCQNKSWQEVFIERHRSCYINVTETAMYPYILVGFLHRKFHENLFKGW